MSLSATPARLDDGTWGMRVRCYTEDATDAYLVGASVTVRTRGGKTWTSIIGEVVSVTADVQDRRKSYAICRKASTQPPAPARHSAPPRTYTAESCGYPCTVTGVRCTPSTPCHDCE